MRIAVNKWFYSAVYSTWAKVCDTNFCPTHNVKIYGMGHWFVPFVIQYIKDRSKEVNDSCKLEYTRRYDKYVLASKHRSNVGGNRI
ncbi:hypothetical protein JPSP43_17420 [Staphylococcus pseudintermedius]|nr:hypothetical protein GSP_18830 [Staphylococcus pseudintermedius]